MRLVDPLAVAKGFEGNKKAAASSLFPALAGLFLGGVDFGAGSGLEEASPADDYATTSGLTAAEKAILRRSFGTSSSASSSSPDDVLSAAALRNSSAAFLEAYHKEALEAARRERQREEGSSQKKSPTPRTARSKGGDDGDEFLLRFSPHSPQGNMYERLYGRHSTASNGKKRRQQKRKSASAAGAESVVSDGDDGIANGNYATLFDDAKMSNMFAPSRAEVDFAISELLRQRQAAAEEERRAKAAEADAMANGGGQQPKKAEQQQQNLVFGVDHRSSFVTGVPGGGRRSQQKKSGAEAEKKRKRVGLEAGSALLVMNPPLFPAAFADYSSAATDGADAIAVGDASSHEVAVVSTPQKSLRSAFAMQNYNAGLGIKYVSIFANPRKFCGEGLIVIPDNGPGAATYNDDREIFMCEVFDSVSHTAAPLPTANPNDPSEPNAEGLTARDYLTRYKAMMSIRKPFTVGQFKNGMTDGQRRTCMIATSAIECVCATDAQRVTNGFGQQQCMMKSIKCDFELTSPPETCVPRPERRAVPQPVQEGCLKASRSDTDYKMTFFPTCSAESLDSAEWSSLGYRLLPKDRLASLAPSQPLLLLARWRNDGSTNSGAAYVAAPKANATAAERAKSSTLATGTYLSLSEDPLLFSYVGASVVAPINNVVNLTAANDLLLDPTFAYFRQLYNFYALSDRSAQTEIKMNYSTNRLEILNIFNSRTSIDVSFNLRSLSDQFFPGGRAYGEIGMEGSLMLPSARYFFLDMDVIPMGTYKKPKSEFSVALIALIVFVAIVALAAAVYCYRNYREKQRAERDRKIAEERGSALWD